MRISPNLIPPPVSKLFGPLLKLEIRLDHPESQGSGKLHSMTGGTFGPHARGHRPHQGVDLFAAVGTAVYAVAPGKIEWIRPNVQGYGNCLLHSFRWHDQKIYYAFFAHLSSIYVKQGQEVGLGMPGIARTGISGNGAAEYPHLHFEIRNSNKKHLPGGTVNRWNPLIFLGPVQYEKNTIDYLMRTSTIA